MHQPQQRVCACTCSPGHLRHPANTAGGALMKPACLKRNTKQGGVSDGIEFSNPANGTVTRKESQIHCLASSGDGIRSDVPAGRRIRKNWLNAGKMWGDRDSRGL